MLVTETKPCEYCGADVSKTKAQQVNRKYWTCGSSCANKLKFRNGIVSGKWSDNPLRGQKETRLCAECGNPVTRYLSQSRVDRPWYCSRTCKGKGSLNARIARGEWKGGQRKRRGTELPCEQCGKPTYRNKSQQKADRGVFCSPECHNESMKKTPVVKCCKNCGKELRLKPSQGARLYCSNRCQGIGTTKRALDWEYNGRLARLDKSGYVMVWDPDHPNKAFYGWQYHHRIVAEATIGRLLTRDDQVHHVNGVKSDNRPENLQVLSGSDHALVTQRDIKERHQAAVDGLAEAKQELEKAQAKIAAYEHRLSTLT